MNDAHSLSDRRWRALLDADAAGEPLTPAERAHLREHRAADPAVRAEQAFYRALAARGAGQDDAPSDADDPLIAASLAGFFEGVPKNLSEETPRTARRAYLAGAGLLLAAGLAAVWLLRPPAPPPEPATVAAASDDAPTPAPAPAPPSVAPPSAAPAALALRAGPLRAEGRDLSPGTALTPGATLQAGDADACLEGPGPSTLCLEPGAGARVLAGGELELTSGAARVAATGPAAIAVVVAGARATADDAEFRLEVSSRAWVADVTRGTVTLADDRGPLARLGPGDRLQRGAQVRSGAAPTPEPTPIEPVRTTRPSRPTRPAPELLDEARALRAAGEHAKAARAYEALITAHPDAPAATAALVTLGQLYLGKLADPAAALRSFDRYLQRAPDGALAEEAAVGRIDALRRLGRTAEERAAIARFLDRHPTSNYADGLRRRLAP